MPPFHLGWFTNFSNPPWNTPWSGTEGRDWPRGLAHVEFTRALERACFDYVMLEDSSMVSDAYEGSTRVDLKHGLYAPKHDPLLLAPLLVAATSRIGVIATASTSFYPPELLARRYATLDDVSHGRIGWNVVTSSEDRAAQNHGMDALPPHDERYARAEEFVGRVRRAWDTRFVGAAAAADLAPVSTLDPPRHPVVCQAGGSPAGRAFAARHADTVLSMASGPEAMAAFRDDLRTRMRVDGRDPDTCKVLFITHPVLADTTEEARAKAAREAAPTPAKVETSLAHLSAVTEIDFGSMDLDAPVGDLRTNGHTTTLEQFKAMGRTLREAAGNWSTGPARYVGTPEEVADLMGEDMAAVGGDGYLITGNIGRRFVGEVTDGLVPALQRRGLVRSEYAHEQFRDNLLEF